MKLARIKNTFRLLQYNAHQIKWLSLKDKGTAGCIAITISDVDDNLAMFTTLVVYTKVALALVTHDQLINRT